MKRLRKILLIAACAALIAAIAGGGLFIVNNLDMVLAMKMDNPYIDAWFSGWQQASVPGLGSFLMPEGWRIEASAAEADAGHPVSRSRMTVNIVAADGTLIAQGLKDAVSPGDSANRNTIKEVVPFEVKEVREQGSLRINIPDRLSVSSPFIAVGDDQEQGVLLLEMSDSDAWLGLWFFLGQGEAQTELIEVTDAIMFSFVSGK